VYLPIEHPHRVPFDGTFRIAESQRAKPDGTPDKDACKDRLDELTDELRELQRRLYADNRWSVLLVFQAMDAAGKDGTVRAVMTGINPAGCQVFAFKQPTPEELDHDFLWRTTKRLPERGRMGIFNRSYYEEVLVVRVHPEILQFQQLPEPVDTEAIWEERFESIRDHERHLEANGTVILKFFLNVSKEEQRQRFLARIEEREKNWKFSAGDVRERKYWDDYMHAYEEALNATSRPWAPWFAIPADSKAYLRMAVAEIIVATLGALDLRYPTLPPEEAAKLDEAREELLAEE